MTDLTPAEREALERLYRTLQRADNGDHESSAEWLADLAVRVLRAVPRLAGATAPAWLGYIERYVRDEISTGKLAELLGCPLVALYPLRDAVQSPPVVGYVAGIPIVADPNVDEGTITLRARPDTIHTCSPQVAAPSGWLTMSRERMDTLRWYLTAASSVGSGVLAEALAEVDAQCRAKEEAEKRLNEPETDLNGPPHVCDPHGVPWRERALVRGNMLRYIAAATTGDADGDPQVGVDELKSRAAALRQIAEEAVNVRVDCTNPEAVIATLRDLRARLAEIGGEDGN